MMRRKHITTSSSTQCLNKLKYDVSVTHLYLTTKLAHNDFQLSRNFIIRYPSNWPEGKILAVQCGSDLFWGEVYSTTICCREMVPKGAAEVTLCCDKNPEVIVFPPFNIIKCYSDFNLVRAERLNHIFSLLKTKFYCWKC